MRGGILIIGSLLWDDGARDEWRRSRLRIDERVCVEAPIRYGRCSRTRGNTFTMIFAPDSPVGQGVLVPCTAPIGNVDSLIAEAEELWRAENPKALSGHIGAKWGCVGVLCRAEAEAASLLQAWACHFRDTKTSPISPVDDRGVLRISWPVKVADGAPADVDVILATATQGEAVQPCAEQIADAWLDQSDERERYFFNNVLNGIRTSDDGLIWRRIEERGPRWLENGAYAEAVAILRGEAAPCI
jgi:hypothetical protein